MSSRVGPNPNSWWNQADSLILGWGWSPWTFWAQLQVCSLQHQTAHSLQSFGLAVLEAEFLRSEFWLEIKILLSKSMSGSSKIASELKSSVSESRCINAASLQKISQKVGVHSLLQRLSETLDFNSDAIFELPDIDLDNRILISSQNSDLKNSASSTVRPKLWRLCAVWCCKLQTSN